MQPLPNDDVVAFDPEPTAGSETVEAEHAGPPAEPIAEPETAETELIGPPAEPIAERVEQVPAASEPQVGFTEAVVAVSEQSTMAQVRLWREAEFVAPLVWWTSEHTASADSDYVPVPERAVDFADGRTLRIPLVNDNLPEQRESFYVDVGVRKPQGQIERLASIRVDIVDDDLR